MFASSVFFVFFPFGPLVISFYQAIEATAKQLSDALEKEITFPSIEHWIESNEGAGMGKYQLQKKLLLFLDGTSAIIRKPHLHAAGHETYVHYKMHNAWRYFVACLPTGEIVFLSNLWMGKSDDTKCYGESGLRELLEEEYGGVDKKGYTLCLGGDKGYVFIVPPDEWELLLTQSAEKEKGGSLQTEVPVGGDPYNSLQYTRIMDTELAKPRSVIERSIGLIKRFKKVYGEQIRLNQGNLFLRYMIVIAVSFANYFIKKGKDDDKSDDETTDESDDVHNSDDGEIFSEEGEEEIEEE